MRVLRFHSCLCLLSLILSIVGTNGHEEHDVEKSNPAVVSTRRPIIYTYLEPFTDRGMTVEDHKALLDFWKSSWEQAGWKPIVLSKNDASQHPDYTRFVAALRELHTDDYCDMLLVRWLAMAQAGGGWLVDYDVFPLRPFAAEKLPNDGLGELTVYGPVAPSLASGSAEAWLATAWVLVENAKQQQRSDSRRMFWTDTLGILQLLRNETCPIRSKRHVVEGYHGLQEKEFSKDDCHARPFRNKWVVHFGPLTMQRGVIPGELRLPKHRVTVAKEWLPKWHQACGGIETVAATD